MSGSFSVYTLHIRCDLKCEEGSDQDYTRTALPIHVDHKAKRNGDQQVKAAGTFKASGTAGTTIRMMRSLHA